MYLYTAKKTKDGSLVYVVDGLNSSRSDFRNAGDLIEKEICGDINKALDNHILLPKKLNQHLGDTYLYRIFLFIMMLVRLLE